MSTIPRVGVSQFVTRRTSTIYWLIDFHNLGTKCSPFCHNKFSILHDDRKQKITWSAHNSFDLHDHRFFQTLSIIAQHVFDVIAHVQSWALPETFYLKFSFGFCSCNSFSSFFTHFFCEKETQKKSRNVQCFYFFFCFWQRVFFFVKQKSKDECKMRKAVTKFCEKDCFFFDDLGDVFIGCSCLGWIDAFSDSCPVAATFTKEPRIYAFIHLNCTKRKNKNCEILQKQTSLCSCTYLAISSLFQSNHFLSQAKFRSKCALCDCMIHSCQQKSEKFVARQKKKLDLWDKSIDALEQKFVKAEIEIQIILQTVLTKMGVTPKTQELRPGRRGGAQFAPEERLNPPGRNTFRSASAHDPEWFDRKKRIPFLRRGFISQTCRDFNLRNHRKEKQHLEGSAPWKQTLALMRFRSLEHCFSSMVGKLVCFVLRKSVFLVQYMKKGKREKNTPSLIPSCWFEVESCWDLSWLWYPDAPGTYSLLPGPLLVWNNRSLLKADIYIFAENIFLKFQSPASLSAFAMFHSKTALKTHPSIFTQFRQMCNPRRVSTRKLSHSASFHQHRWPLVKQQNRWETTNALEERGYWNNAYGCAVVDTPGSPSNTMIRSAKYVAMIKSCSTTKAVFLLCITNLEQNTATFVTEKPLSRTRRPGFFFSTFLFLSSVFSSGGGQSVYFFPKKSGRKRFLFRWPDRAARLFAKVSLKSPLSTRLFCSILLGVKDAVGNSSPFDDFSGVNSLFRVEISGRFVQKIDVGWLSQAQCDSDSLHLSTRQVLHLQNGKVLDEVTIQEHFSFAWHTSGGFSRVSRENSTGQFLQWKTPNRDQWKGKASNLLANPNFDCKCKDLTSRLVDICGASVLLLLKPEHLQLQKPGSLIVLSLCFCFADTDLFIKQLWDVERFHDVGDKLWIHVRLTYFAVQQLTYGTRRFGTDLLRLVTDSQFRSPFCKKRIFSKGK